MVFVQTHTSEQVVTYRKGAVKKPVQVKINLSSETCKQMQIRGIRKVSAADCTRCQHALLSLRGNPVLGLGSQFHRKRLWERIPTAVRAPAAALRPAVLKIATGHQHYISKEWLYCGWTNQGCGT